MSKLLNDKALESILVDTVIHEVIEEAGFPPDEAIPALVRAIGILSKMFPRPDLVLDEASTLLADLEV